MCGLASIQRSNAVSSPCVRNCTHKKQLDLISAAPTLYIVALRLLLNVARVTNLEAVKIEFRHLPFHILLLLQTA